MPISVLVDSEQRSDVLPLAIAELLQDYSYALNRASVLVHRINWHAGWWSDLKTGEPKDRNFAEMIALAHSELSEALEGYRKNLMDDHLPHRKSVEVELADAVIRIFDTAAGLGLNLGDAICEKVAFNVRRADHKPENRAAEHGKKI